MWQNLLEWLLGEPGMKAELRRVRFENDALRRQIKFLVGQIDDAVMTIDSVKKTLRKATS